MKKTVSSLLLAILFLIGCETGRPPATQTHGGAVSVAYATKTGDFIIKSDQPSNPDQEATIEFEVIPDPYLTKVDNCETTADIISIPGFRIRATTGSSREDTAASFGLKLDQYRPFSYLGAAMCLAGVVIFVASFKFPLIPKMAGPIVFAGGAATAYMATAIPEYGHYALGISLIGFVAWYYHHKAAVKHPDEFIKKPKKEMSS